MEEHIELGNLGLGSFPSIDDYLKKNYKTINNNFSKTQNSYCSSNNCSHCNTLIGNYYIVEDPHDIFNNWITEDLNKCIVEIIPFEKFNVEEANLVGLEKYFSQIF